MYFCFLIPFVRNNSNCVSFDLCFLIDVDLGHGSSSLMWIWVMDLDTGSMIRWYHKL